MISSFRSVFGHSTLPDPLKTLVAVGCVYELAALPDRSPLPTISDLMHRATMSRRARFVAWWLVGYSAAHLFGVDT